jgi:uncharacterized membrane protein YphA (DoxX/SURF4 family)
MEPSLLSPPQPWSTTQKIFFRFGVLFVVFFIFFKPNQSYTIGLYNFYIQPFIHPIQWLARNVLRISHPVQFYDGSDGGADDLFDYLSLFVVFVLSITGALIWSLVDRKPRNYRVLQYWFTVIIRYYLALSMFDYGLAKLFMVQFAEATPGQLAEPYGTTSPMGLAWKFFGYSRGYNYFLGFGELLGSALLLFRRTARLGAIVMLVVTINVMAVNYFYDVVVKEVSTMLVIMSLILLLQDYRHHAAFFIFNRQTEPVPLYKPRFQKRSFNISLVIVKYLVIIIPFVLAYRDIKEATKMYGPHVPKPAVFGIYDTEVFIRNSDTLAPLTTDIVRWRKLIVGNRGTALIKLMNDSTRSYLFKADSVAKSISLVSRDSSRKGSFNYILHASGELSLSGIWTNRNRTDSLKIIMKRVDLNNFRLVRSKMHFINEFSTNY